MSQLSQHPLWPELAPYLKIEVCAEDGKKRPRIRIEWKAMPPELHARAVAAVMPCVTCGALVHFVRSRHAAAQRGSKVGHSYYAPCCPLTVNIGCSRGAAAAAEYMSIREEQYAPSHATVQRWF